MYLVNRYTYCIFWDMLHNVCFFLPQNALYFIMLSFLVHKIFMFYIKCALTFKCQAHPPKC
jgi:hypothetical protein